MLSKTMEDALNAQVNAELWSGYLYLSMSCNFEAAGRKGIANWFKVQYQEEIAHAQIFMNYINSRGGRVELKPIAAVQTEWATPIEAFKDTLVHEQKVTSLIYELYALAEKEKDYAALQKLNWFISEQVEEEENAKGIIDKFELIGDNGYGIFQLDAELATRTYVAPAELTQG
jgi:ferritin